MITVSILPILKDNYVYILTAENKDCAVIDAGQAESVIEYLEANKLKPSLILNTHHHSDHVGGNSNLKNKYNAKIVAPMKEANKIGNVDIPLLAGDTFSFGAETANTIASEGHTAGALMYHFPQSKLLFVGDTLFSMGCGRLFEGTPEQMYKTLQSIAALPDDTKIYCGHEYTLTNGEFCLSQAPDNQNIINRINEVKNLRQLAKPSLPTTLMLEKQTNLFLMAKSLEEFTHLREKRNNF